MNINKRIIILLLSLCCGSLMIGCGSVNGDKTLCEITKHNNGLVRFDEDYLSSISYIVTYNGNVTKIEHYNLSEDKITSYKVDNIDTVIDICKNFNSTQTQYLGADAPSYDIVYYDENGKSKQITEFTDSLGEAKQILNICVK